MAKTVCGLWRTVRAVNGLAVRRVSVCANGFGLHQLVQTPFDPVASSGEARELLYEEAPAAYKNIEAVIKDLVSAGLVHRRGDRSGHCSPTRREKLQG